MKRRLYFVVPDVSSARHIRNELLLTRMGDSRTHVTAKDCIPLASGTEPTILGSP